MSIQDSTRTISKSAKRFFSGTLISRSTGMAREIAMAAVFGASPTVAAFWMAFRFSHLLRRLFGEGALNAAFIPHFESLRSQDPKIGARFFYDLLMGLTFVLLILTIMIEIGLGGWLVYGKPGHGNADVIRLTMLMLPSLIFISLYAVNSSLLNCERSYFLPSAAPVVLNLVWIGAVFYLKDFSQTRAIEYLAMVLVFAFALQWLVTVPKVWHFLAKELAGSIRETRFSAKEIIKILRPFSLGLLGVAATQINSALDSLFARAADPQGPAYLWYALRIQQLPLALFGIGLTGALLPPIARAIQQGEKSRYLYFLNFALRKTFLLMIPMSAALFSLGFSGINLVFGHGEFNQQAIKETTLCLWAYGLALLPMTLVLIFASAFYAKKNYLTPALLAILTVALNIGLNALFVFVLGMGAVSIALATALTSFANAILLGMRIQKEEGLELQGVFLLFLKISLAALAAMSISAVLGVKLFQDNTLLCLTGHPLVPFPRLWMKQALLFMGQALTFGGAFFSLARILKIKEIVETRVV